MTEYRVDIAILPRLPSREIHYIATILDKNGKPIESYNISIHCPSEYNQIEEIAVANFKGRLALLRENGCHELANEMEARATL